MSHCVLFVCRPCHVVLDCQITSVHSAHTHRPDRHLCLRHCSLTNCVIVCRCHSSQCDYDNYQYAINVINNTPIYTWIHLLIVIQQDPTNSTAAFYYSYVNGQLTMNAAGQWYPAGVYRQNGFMARSEWGAD